MKDSFRELSFQELLKKRDDLLKEYRDHRFNIVLGHVENPLRGRTLRRQIARVLTLIREHELGIRKG